MCILANAGLMRRWFRTVWHGITSFSVRTPRLRQLKQKLEQQNSASGHRPTRLPLGTFVKKERQTVGHLRRAQPTQRSSPLRLGKSITAMVAAHWQSQSSPPFFQRQKPQGMEPVKPVSRRSSSFKFASSAPPCHNSPRHHGVREVLHREPNGEVSQLAINAVVAFSVLEQA